MHGINHINLFISNSAARPDVSGPVMIREDLLKPIKDAVPR